jgi:hypothetical protein
VIEEAVNILGISEWYSLHVMTTCEGMYQSNHEARDAALNVTECSNLTSNSKSSNLSLEVSYN